MSFFGTGAGAGAGAGSSTGAAGSGAEIPLPKKASIVPWVEKYRPKDVSSIASQADIVKSLKNAVATGNVRVLLFIYSINLCSVNVN